MEYTHVSGALMFASVRLQICILHCAISVYMYHTVHSAISVYRTQYTECIVGSALTQIG